MDQLFVVTAVSNPRRYQARWELYQRFAKHMEASGAKLITVEAAFGDRPFEVTEPGHPFHVQVRTEHEIWLKENLINLGWARVPLGYNYMAYADADLTFNRPDWAEETVHLLQHYDAVQMFSDITQLGPSEEPLGTAPSFVAAWLKGKTLRTPQGIAAETRRFAQRCTGNYPGSDEGDLGAPGGAWAYRRSALDALGGLLDNSLVGHGDYYMAAALFGLLHLVMADGYHPRFVSSMSAWESRALRGLRKNIGCVPGLVTHHWHGPMRNRGYSPRWKLLIDYEFDPTTDLARDAQGVYQLVDDGSERMRRLRDELKSYFNFRREDDKSL